MASLRQMAENVRLRIGEPRINRPSKRAVMQSVVTHVQSSIFNRISSTGKGWTIDEVPLSVASGQETYTLNVGSEFGQAVDVYTVDPGNPSHIPRSIPFWNVQDAHFNWGYPNNIASSFLTPDGSPNTATRIAFYRDSVGDVYAKVFPIPQLAALYQVMFSVGNFIDTAGIDSSPLLSEYHMLPEVRAGLSLLPQSEWSDDSKVNTEKRKDLALSLKNDEAIFRNDFENAIRTQQGSKMACVNTLSFD
jgi:hypothetical protein